MAMWADEAGSNGSNSPRRFAEEHGEIHLKHSRHSSVYVTSIIITPASKLK